MVELLARYGGPEPRNREPMMPRTGPDLSRLLAIIVACVVGILPGHVTAASLLSCTLVKKSESAYWYKEGVWAGLDPALGTRMPRGTLFREYLPTVSDHSHVPIGYLFAQLDNPDVVVKQLYVDGSSGIELPGRVLNRTRDSVLVLWPIPMLNEIRLALINTEAKRAVINVMGAGVVALEVASGLAECK